MRIGRLKFGLGVVVVLIAGNLSGPAMAEDAIDGWYARGEIGGAVLAQDQGYWQNGQGDPQITFSLDRAAGITGGAAVGYDWMNGIRTDLSLMLNGGMDVTADILSASDNSDTSVNATTVHVQQITTSVSSQAVMANLFVEPMKAMGDEGPIQPFVTAGLGVARVSMGQWTRYNPDPPGNPQRIYRTFEGDSQFNLAWSVGGGVSFDLGEVAGGHPAILELTYKYSDLGNVAGSATPLPDNGSSTPEEPFNFDYTTHTITVGLRVPLVSG